MNCVPTLSASTFVVVSSSNTLMLSEPFPALPLSMPPSCRLHLFGAAVASSVQPVRTSA